MSSRTPAEKAWDDLKKLNFDDSPMNKLYKSEVRKNNLKESLDNRTFEERSEMSKKGWNNEEGYEERREHIKVQAEKNKEENAKRLREITSNVEHQSNAGKKGGLKGGKTMGNKVSYCQYCQETYKGVSYNRYHGEKCKKNPNREIVYNYELVQDGQSYGKFEEKQDIANHLECSAALISRYMSGKKKDIKGYQIKTLNNGK